jgi:hypothetical protein
MPGAAEYQHRIPREKVKTPAYSYVDKQRRGLLAETCERSREGKEVNGPRELDIGMEGLSLGQKQGSRKFNTYCCRVVKYWCRRPVTRPPKGVC